MEQILFFSNEDTWLAFFCYIAMVGLVVPEAVFANVCVVLMAVCSVFERPNLFMWFSWTSNDQVRF